ncbi:MAG: hypothetical protein ACYC27_18075, partial [Armatimonadota bacterium]
DQLRRDVDALQARVAAVEAEQRRVVFTGEANFIARGEVRNTETPVFDRDGREVAGDGFDVRSNRLLNNSSFFTDYQFGVKGRVSDSVNVNALIAAGNYLPGFAGIASDDFTLWNMNMDAAVNLGPLGKTQVVVGRFPFQLTPLTLKFVDPDSYTNIGKTDNGDFVLDGGRASFNIGKLGMTVFATKVAPENELGDLITPDLMISDFFDGISVYQTEGGISEVEQLAGARAVIGTPFNGNLGLTYYQAGLANIDATTQVYGADLNANIGGLGIAGEYAVTEPNDTLEEAAIGNGAPLGEDNAAWNAKLNYQFGSIGVGAGYTTVESNYYAPGYWSRLGQSVNLVNVKGITANMNIGLGSKISLVGDAMFLEPENEAADTRARMALVQNGGPSVSGDALDKITYWKAGLKYGLTSANSVDLGWEEVKWEPIAGNDTTERYITLGIGHSFNPNASMKLSYQIIDFETGTLNPFFDESGYRGGVATAQFQLKY